jgi:glycosyl transferase family protein with helical bundle domain
VTPDEERLRQFGAMIGRLIRKEDLSRAEAKECWRQICMREQPDLQQGAFMAAFASPEFRTRHCNGSNQHGGASCRSWVIICRGAVKVGGVGFTPNSRHWRLVYESTP